jgi:hypothetical protein
VKFYIDNILKASLISMPYAWTWDQGKPLNFRHHINIVASDKAGHSTEATMTVWTLL